MAAVSEGYWWWRSQPGAAWKVVRVRHGYINHFSAPPSRLISDVGEFGEKIEPPKR